jgi:hypothetical protein
MSVHVTSFEVVDGPVKAICNAFETDDIWRIRINGLTSHHWSPPDFQVHCLDIESLRRFCVEILHRLAPLEIAVCEAHRRLDEAQGDLLKRVGGPMHLDLRGAQGQQPGEVSMSADQILALGSGIE